MNITSLLWILWARRWVVAIIAGSAFLASLAFTLATPKFYTATTDLIVDGKGQDPVSGLANTARTMAGYLGTQTEVIRSRSVAEKVVEQQQLLSNAELVRKLKLKGDEQANKERLIGYIGDGLDVNSRRDSNVISVSFKAHNSALAAQIANGIAQAYLDTNLDLRIEPARQITRWYDQQLAALRNNLVEKQNALSAYQEQHGILVSSDRLDLESAKLSELSSMLIAAQGERLNSTSRNEVSRNGAQAMDNPQVQKISGDLAQAQAKLSDLGNTVGENHPQYRQAQGEVDALKQQLAQVLRLIGGSLRSSVQLSQNREAQLQAELAAQKERVMQLSRNRNDLTLLKQEVDNAQAAYDAALARASQTRLESQVALTDISILNTAIAGQTTHKMIMILLLGSLTGLLLGVAVALCWEWADRRVRNRHDLETGLGLPVLACVPARKLLA